MLLKKALLEPFKNTIHSNYGRIHSYASVCPICEKSFYASTTWVYKRHIKRKDGAERDIHMCTYKCLREYDRREEKRKE